MSPSSPGPVPELARLAPAMGAKTGGGTYWPPQGDPVSVRAVTTGYWDEGERFTRLEYAHEAEDGSVLSLLIISGYNVEMRKYRTWVFSRSHPEPMEFTGDIVDGWLVNDGHPGATVYGQQKLRVMWSLKAEEPTSVRVEYWTPTGYEPMLDVTLRPDP